MTTYAYGPVPFNGVEEQDAVRYTSVAAVKDKLQVVTEVWDNDIEEIIVATEATLDLLNGRSVPDVVPSPLPDPLPDDWPEMPLYDHVPWQIKRIALDAAVTMFRRVDYINATAGSDLFAGIDVAAQIQQTVRNHPLNFGFQVAWGMA